MIVLVIQLNRFSLNLPRIEVERRLSERQSSDPAVIRTTAGKKKIPCTFQFLVTILKYH
jgi:hypothetical protein